MRLPLPPATLRAGGRISAGMISTVHTPLPILAAMAPSDWPHLCAPSPESLTISTTCCVKVTTGLSPEAGATFPAVSPRAPNLAFAFMGSSVSRS